MGTFVKRSNTVHVLMVLDMSGSMRPQWDDTIGGANAYFDGLKEDTDTDYRVTIVNFDTEYMVLCAGVPLSEVPTLDRNNYTPRGTTALYDAVGRAITETEAKVADNEKAIVVIITDGQENSSREESASTIKPRIEKMQEKGNWTFVFLGAVASAWDDATKMGISPGNTMRFNKARTKGMYDSLGKSTILYASQCVSSNNVDYMKTYGADLQEVAEDDEDGQ